MKCPQCGLDLPPGAPEGLCQRCLLQACVPGVAPTSAYVAGPASPGLAELQRLLPQLELVELIGAGVAMNNGAPDALIQAIAQLRRIFPEWRLGQLVANVMTAAGCLEVESLWDVEDERLLAAGERLIATNQERQAVQA
jgi:hypothetical protein